MIYNQKIFDDVDEVVELSMIQPRFLAAILYKQEPIITHIGVSWIIINI